MTYIFKTKLSDTSLSITRTVQIPASNSLSTLAYTLLTVYGAQGYHLFDFRIGKTTYGCDEESKKLACDISVEEAFNKVSTAVFSYDYGDGWEFDVRLSEKVEGEGEIKLLSGTGRGIIEDVGGVSGLEAFVEAFRTHSSEGEDGEEDDDREPEEDDYAEFCDWQGIESYDAETCKVDRINEGIEDSIEALRIAYENGGVEEKAEDTEQFKEWYEDCFGVRYWSEEE